MLNGKKILFTGLIKDKNDFAELINNGAEIIFFPAIKIVGLTLTDNEKVKLNNALNYDYLIFTSVNAVKFFLNNIEKNINEINNSPVQVTVIGDKTKSAAESKGFKISLMPEKSSSESLNEFLDKEKVFNKKILIPGSKIANPNLRNSFLQKEAVVDFIPVYNTVSMDEYSEAAIEKIKNTLFDLIVFTSPSTFNNFVKLLKVKNVQNFFAKQSIASIGPATKREIEKKNLTVDVLPENYNIKSLIKEIIKFYK